MLPGFPSIDFGQTSIIIGNHQTNYRQMYAFSFFRIASLTSLLIMSSASAMPEGTKNKVEPVRIEHEIRQIEGWIVHVDVSLLEGEHKETGDLVLRILGERLHEIILLLPAEPVAKMKEVPIYLDRDHPLGNAHYHPSGDWLETHGYDPAMGKAVQITNASSLIHEARSPNSDSVMLHELAHAYHDRVLGFDHPEIITGYKEFCDSRKFDNTAHVSGRNQPHYGLTDHKEYFAELTETFFVGNDYFPFNHYELFKEHPSSYELIARTWGSKMKPPVTNNSGEQSILDLRILATLLSQRGEFDESLALVAKAAERSTDSEGRIADLRKEIEAQRDQATEKKDGK
jgi:hypothetical protein